VRLTGCPLRCVYCDTTYAFSGGQTMTLEAILRRWRATERITSPSLAANRCAEELFVLLRALCDAAMRSRWKRAERWM